MDRAHFSRYTVDVVWLEGKYLYNVGYTFGGIQIKCYHYAERAWTVSFNERFYYMVANPVAVLLAPTYNYARLSLSA